LITSAGGPARDLPHFGMPDGITGGPTFIRQSTAEIKQIAFEICYLHQREPRRVSPATCKKLPCCTKQKIVSRTMAKLAQSETSNCSERAGNRLKNPAKSDRIEGF
jgi:hypothetical protein